MPIVTNSAIKSDRETTKKLQEGTFLALSNSFWTIKPAQSCLPATKGLCQVLEAQEGLFKVR